jgi:hypothetical protein
MPGQANSNKYRGRRHSGHKVYTPESDLTLFCLLILSLPTLPNFNFGIPRDRSLSFLSCAVVSIQASLPLSEDGWEVTLSSHNVADD